MESVPASDTYFVGCTRSHRVTVDAAFQSVIVQLRERLLPACPQANGEDGCAYVLSPRDAEEVLNLHYETEAPSAEDVEALGLRQVYYLSTRLKQLAPYEGMRAGSCSI
jgi:hypothetical protein